MTSKPLTLEAVCQALNSGQSLNEFPADTNWQQLAVQYAKRFNGPDGDKRWIEHDSVEVMCPGISGQFLDMVLEEHIYLDV